MHWAYILLIIATLWFLVYIIGRYFKLDEKYGWTLGPLFLLIRTKRFNNFITKVAVKHARFWRFFGNLSIFFGFISMFVSFGVLLFSLINIFLPSPPIEGPTVGLIIPGVTISFKTALYLIIPIIFTMIPHEFAHGVVSCADEVEIKSTGLAFFAIFFGAFVEPSEEDMNKTSYAIRMRTYAAGMFPNLILGLLTIPILIYAPYILAPFYHPADGILIKEVVVDGPADNAGLKRGVAIFDVNSTHLYNSSIFSNYMISTSPNQLVVLNTTEGIFNVRLGINPDNDTVGYLGIYSVPYQEPKSKIAWKFFPMVFEQQLVWMIVVTLGTVLFNALPIPFFLDGDKILSSFLLRFIRKRKVALIILDVFRFLAITLFLAILIIPIIKFGFITLG
ncbi:MAG: site-2 protease family protein [Candidatus Heimdallarchaeota archaeon]|nr:site-2 protease family protein [Candidatus Heimdallarchaeota archaeon]